MVWAIPKQEAWTKRILHRVARLETWAEQSCKQDHATGFEISAPILKLDFSSAVEPYIHLQHTINAPPKTMQALNAEVGQSQIGVLGQ
jgi:hypothetical protein